MRNVTNDKDTGRTITDYFFPKGKATQQETPMKPVQPPNYRAFNTTPKQALPQKSHVMDYRSQNAPLPHYPKSPRLPGTPCGQGHSRSSTPSSVTSRSVQEVHPLLCSRSDVSSPWSSAARRHSNCSQSSQHLGDRVDKRRNGCPNSPSMHIPGTPQRDHESLEQNFCSSTMGTNAGGSSGQTMKRHRNSEDRDFIDDRAKRSCPSDTRAGPIVVLDAGPSLMPSQPLRSQSSVGVKQAYIKPSGSSTVRIQEWHPPLKDERVYGKGREKRKDCLKTPVSTKLVKQHCRSQSLASNEVSKYSGNHRQSSNPHVGCLASVRFPNSKESQAKSREGNSRGKPMGSSDCRPSKPSSSLISGSLRPHGKERKKTTRPQRASIQQDELFTPDPVISVSSIGLKTTTSSSERGEAYSPTHRYVVSCPAAHHSFNGVGSPSRMTQGPEAPSSLSAVDPKIPQMSSPCVGQEPCKIAFIKLERVSLSKICPPITSKKSSEASCTVKEDSGITYALTSSQVTQCKDELVKKETEKKSPLNPKSDRPCTDMKTLKGTPSLHLSRFITPATLGDGEGERMGGGEEEDPLDMELDLSLELDLDLSEISSSSSSEEDQLPSLQEILDRSVKPPDTPEKGTFPEPSTPVLSRHQSKHAPVASKGKPVSYKNTLEQMLKEKESNQRSKEIEMKLLLSCKEDLLRLKEEEESDENLEEAISNEHKEFLLRFSVVSSAIRDLHPGEEVFCLANFGRLFNQHSLCLRQCNVTPQGTAQKALLWSSPDQFRSYLSAGLLQAAYQSSPCPPQVALMLFQLMSVHSERSISDKILQALKDIASSAAEHIVVRRSDVFEVWVPSVGDVTLVLMNMGVPFVTLFPLESLQPSFTEGDLLEGIQITTESLSSKKEPCTFPEHNFKNVIKYLSDVTALCPRAYSDTELLLLLAVVSRVGLEMQLTLLPTVELCSLENNLVNNMRDWDDMLPKICLTLANLTEDHHNLRWLVQLLPDNTRGTQLRRHASVAMISKLLNHTCTYKPSNTPFQLSSLRRYLPRMRPSALVKGLPLSRRSHRQREQEGEEDNDPAALDQQAYYLCYSLLALANEASNFEFFPPDQKDQLLLLCAELEKHIKCDIRESEKCLYRSKVKDFVARIYTKWQVLLQRTRPLQGKLYDYWQPLPEDMLVSSQGNCSTHREGETEGEGEEAVMDEEEEMEEEGKYTWEGSEEVDLTMKEKEEEQKIDRPAEDPYMEKEEMVGEEEEEEEEKEEEEQEKEGEMEEEEKGKEIGDIEEEEEEEKEEEQEKEVGEIEVEEKRKEVGDIEEEEEEEKEEEQEKEVGEIEVEEKRKEVGEIEEEEEEEEKEEEQEKEVGEIEVEEKRKEVGEIEEEEEEKEEEQEKEVGEIEEEELLKELEMIDCWMKGEEQNVRQEEDVTDEDKSIQELKDRMDLQEGCVEEVLPKVTDMEVEGVQPETQEKCSRWQGETTTAVDLPTSLCIPLSF